MMATYFNGGGSEIQADNLQTLYLMNPSYSVDSQTTPPGMLYLNQASVQHAPHPHHLVGIVPLAPQEDDPRFHYSPVVGFHHRRRQGLSLSLNSSPANKNVDRSPTSASGVSSGVIGGIFGCKYMKAAEQLLDEVVNVGKVMKMEVKEYKSVVNVGKVMKMELISTAQRQELQMKKAKLLNMLDEVEQRYRQYHSQMQVVASSYEQAAGPGSAKSYTSLALDTISKQFRCLKDTIASQIKATGRSLGEEEEEEGEGRSRLRLVDQQMRQQRAALHQIGMMQHHPHNAWRPQRGLPEKAVSALRAWLFDHFLHPYPKDSDKHMLAKQTGLTRSQVSNWFINARVRLWKPMVEEMYLEETKSAQLQNDSEAQTTTTNNNNNNKESPPTLQSPRITQSPKLPPPPTNSINNIPHSTIVSPSTRPTPHTFEPSLQGFSLIGQPSSGMESLIMRSPKRQRGNIVVDTQHNSPSSNLSMDHHTGFGSNYPVGDIGSRFNPHQQLGQGQYHQGGNGAVSLTLGLPHCENLLSSLSSGTHHHQQNFMPGAQAEFCTPQPSHSGVGGVGGSYEGVDIQDRKRFVAQLLSDFVV